MYSVLFWFIAVFGGILQIVCSVYGKNKLHRLLPMGVWVVIMVATLIFGSIFGSLGLAAALILFWNELKVLLIMAAAYGLVALVDWTKK